MTSREGVLDRLARAQTKGFVWIVLLALAIGAGSVPFVRRLKLNSEWTALLPANKPSVIDLERARNRVGGLTSLAICIESRDVAAMQRLARALVPRLEGMRARPGNPVRSVDWNVATFEDFAYEHRHLYASVEELTRIRDALQERLDYERLRRNPLYVDLGEEPPPEPREVVASLRRRSEEARTKLARYPGGFYVHPDRDLLVIFLRTDLAGGDADGAHRLIAAVGREIAALRPTSFARDMKIEYAGDLLVASEEHDAVLKELTIATVLTIGLCLLSIYLFFFRARAIAVLGLGLAVPVLVTFAFAQLTVDHLNVATAFLGSIVIGNGINPMIVWLARYFEERRKGLAVAEAVASTHRNAWLGTLGASLAAAISYGSLVITDFRGFRDFGIIGGVGMVLCWIATLLVLPSIAVLFEKIRPMAAGGGAARRNFYGNMARRAVFALPRGIVIGSLVLMVVGVVLVARAVAADPIDYNMRNLRSVRESTSRAGVLNRRMSVMGIGGVGNGIALLVPHRADAMPFRREMDRRRERQHAPWGEIRSIDDLLPTRQAEKLPVLREIRALLLDAREYANERDQREIDQHIPPANLHALGDADLPEEVARPFTERDGTRGRILFVARTASGDTWDGRYLIAWAKALRELRLPDGTRPPLVGRAPIFADMLEVVYADGPKAVLASLLATCLLVLLSFRRKRDSLLTLGALFLGVAWMTGTMAALGMKLNFLNFVALPITFGIGVDYAVNVMRRHDIETRAGAAPEDAVRASLDETGGAVILCSLTTIFGYISLFTSANLALNSFGAAMTISELACLFAAITSMPAALLVLGRRPRKTDG